MRLTGEFLAVFGHIREGGGRFAGRGRRGGGVLWVRVLDLRGSGTGPLRWRLGRRTRVDLGTSSSNHRRRAS